MSRRIIKNRQTISTEGFQFDAVRHESEEGDPYSPPPNSLEADAELDAFQENAFGGQGGAPGGFMGGAAGTANAAQHVDVESLIARAREEADLIIRGAQEHASAIERDAYEKGLEEGRKTGEIMADQQLQQMLNHYQFALTQIDQMRALLLDQMQLDVLDLVWHTAQKVLKAELKSNPQSILPMIKDAIHTLKHRRNITIFLNPVDHTFINSLSENERQSWLGTSVHLEIDPQLSRGGFRIDTVAGELDARIEVQFQQLQQHVQQHFEKPS
ncbi:FliH/SctL family protein [Acanthopleuribacter pedis]|uniref:Flagellar assembly protein FliH n=1 Tax=Acanthopleuribacter pedis TaxID=442870 RepID=A0A8J7U2D1_9BACT|nr:FliH/SctL family protein [Acanthopleuribacter pedis]MBO1317579.1 hypothetical protein [Acanthopleuribacter pedis]